jgi:hypothetical protein
MPYDQVNGDRRLSCEISCNVEMYTGYREYQASLPQALLLFSKHTYYLQAAAKSAAISPRLEHGMISRS